MPRHVKFVHATGQTALKAKCPQCGKVQKWFISKYKFQSDSPFIYLILQEFKHLDKHISDVHNKEKQQHTC